MKKLGCICCVLAGLLVAIPSFAANCEGGTTFNGKYGDKHEFCVSKGDMNWFAAVAWCQAQGRVLANFKQACNTNDNPGNCGNVNGVLPRNSWLNANVDKSSAYYVGTYGGVATSTRTNSAAALCW